MNVWQYKWHIVAQILHGWDPLCWNFGWNSNLHSSLQFFMRWAVFWPSCYWFCLLKTMPWHSCIFKRLGLVGKGWYHYSAGIVYENSWRVLTIGTSLAVSSPSSSSGISWVSVSIPIDEPRKWWNHDKIDKNQKLIWELSSRILEWEKAFPANLMKQTFGAHGLKICSPRQWQMVLRPQL